MDHLFRADSLAPFDRLQLRDLLQDRWCEQVRQITLLSLARHDAEWRTMVEARIGTALDGSDSVQAAIRRARAIQDDIQRALQRLNDRTYGRCARCGQEIGLSRLLQLPEATQCDGCDPSMMPACEAPTVA